MGIFVRYKGTLTPLSPSQILVVLNHGTATICSLLITSAAAYSHPTTQEDDKSGEESLQLLIANNPKS